MNGKEWSDAVDALGVVSKRHAKSLMSSLNEILHYLDTTSRVSCPQITCEQAAVIAALLRKANSYEDCGQDGVCAISPGCNRHFLDFNRELAVRLTDKQSLQEACGFAWDCGREIAATQSEASINDEKLIADKLREALQQLVSAVRPTIGATQEQKDEMLGRYFDALDNAEKLLRAFKGVEK